ncbi:hypothetical protein LTS18_008983 [Coniosporium uncinatum]|uniref:Uncharacterized protein n=1 Tax=Coniosporium uncinatum TaxID=93489 RepID=A0ACC3DZA2_9PEZI|nr:hypothetical protein LTS18_008983 [Coniosporium uncinatum]
MADIAKKQVEKEEIREISDSKLSDYDRELQQALREYVPGSDEEKKLLNYVDRTNIGNAKIAGMDKALGLDDHKYQWIISIFFFGYLRATHLLLEHR